MIRKTIAFVSFLCGTIIACNHISRAQQPEIDAFSLKKLNQSHDINLGDWGPYSKKYAGISHIPELSSGMRFDFFVIPGYYRNKIMVPNVLFESGYYTWFADLKTRQYAYRYELEWKDRVYTDVNYKIINNKTVMAEIKCVNNTNLKQNLSINLMAAISLPEIWPNKKLIKPAGSTWINAVDYKALNFVNVQPKDNLVTDGLMKGEVRNADFIDGSALSKRFCQNTGNELIYNIPVNFDKGNIYILFRGKKGSTTFFSLEKKESQRIMLNGTGLLSSFKIPFDAKGRKEIKLKSLGGDDLEINGLLFSKDITGKVSIEDNEKSEIPEVIANTSTRRILLKYRHAKGFYGFTWDKTLFKIREIRSDDLDGYFRKMVHNHVDSVLRGNDRGHYENVFIRPIEIPANSEISLHCLLAYGDSQEEVDRTLDAFETLKKEKKIIDNDQADYLKEAKPYAFSNKMLKATLLENIVYPIYSQRKYIRHYTPGKWWNSLYTWDSGFIALGLNEVDITRALECINAYTTPAGSQSAFIHHGSPVPVQVYAFMDLWNKSQSRDLADYFYPRLKQYYDFLSGQSGSSTTRSLSSGMLKTWDYFYNSGGWDDYPAQVGVHQGRKESSVAPVITTAHCIRFAKLLRMIAKNTGHQADLASYDRDIKLFGDALQNYSWNEKSGYFSYVNHDRKGNAIGPFTDKSGNDYNMGLDGAYPLIAGICTAAQQSMLLNKIFSPKHMWTPSGLGVVDQSAPYYRKDGYWNGSVWMPHQWFIWKTMLDLGKPKLAMQIAKTGLDVFRMETDYSYYSFEHYLSDSGRGAGWHQFSGLTSPVMSWYNACFKQGTVTTGFEVLLEKSVFSKKNDEYEGTLSFDDATKPHVRSLMICLNPSYKYRAYFKGTVVDIEQAYPGLILITLPAGNSRGELVVKRV